MLNLPNFLTLIRILTIPFFLVYLAYHRYGEAFIVFVLGGVTDFLDGLTARLMHQQTAIGAYLDPAADKLLVITSFVMLSLIDAIPMWLAVVVVSRDILLIIGYAIIYFLVEERRRVALLMGEMGIGKSLLLCVFATAMRRAGRPVVTVNLLGLDQYQLMSATALVRFWTLVLAAYVFLEEERAVLEQDWQRHVSIGETQHEIQRVHWFHLITWMQQQLRAGQTSATLFRQLAA